MPLQAGTSRGSNRDPAARFPSASGLGWAELWRAAWPSSQSAFLVVTLEPAFPQPHLLTGCWRPEGGEGLGSGCSSALGSGTGFCLNWWGGHQFTCVSLEES